MFFQIIFSGIPQGLFLTTISHEFRKGAARLPAPRDRFQLSDLMQTLETPLDDLMS